MRDLSLQELHHVYGANAPLGYSAQEIVSITATMGHAVGTFIKGLQTRDYDSSVTDLADSIKFCRKFLSSMQSLDPSGRLKRCQPLTAAFHFGCGIYKVLYPDKRGG